MLNIIEVTTKKQRKEFVQYPLRLYKGNPYFVPPLYGDEMKMFTDKNVYSKTCQSVFYLAQRDGKTVGRIQGIIQRQYNDIHQTKQVRFTRFDCENDEATAKALFDAVESWGKANGMTDIVGPLGYSDLEREGLLIEGFDQEQTFEEQYNYEYYANLIESNGYEKAVDWVEHRLFRLLDDKARLDALLYRSFEKYNLHIGGEKMRKGAFIKKYADGIFACIDECYKDLYGTVPFTKEMAEQMVAQFKLVVNKRFICVMCDENEKVVAFGLCLPGIGKAVQKSGGRLTPGCLIRLLKAIRKPKVIDMALVGILPEYRKAGLTAGMLSILGGMVDEKGVEYMETNLNLEDNVAIQATWKRFDHIQHKRRRCYKKTL
ncbi:MAG: N-acetyltransferase [Clostridiales bacterium]|nr:N-acetyltransferase [Clostridiales bacterium]